MFVVIVVCTNKCISKILRMSGKHIIVYLFKTKFAKIFNAKNSYCMRINLSKSMNLP